MPTLVTRGAATLRGISLLSPITAQLRTVNFTSSGTWVAPASVANVSTISGEGADGSPSSTSYIAPIYRANKNSSGTGSNPAYLDWSDLYNSAVNARNAFVASIGGNGPSSVLLAYIVDIFSNSSWNVTTYNNQSAASLQIVSVTALTTIGSPPTSGSIVYNSFNSGDGWRYEVEYATPGTIGASSTALGLTFPGGSYGPASPTTYTNVSVTPGTTYTINVASGGFVQIQYYA